jgi:hypothetical protein
MVARKLTAIESELKDVDYEIFVYEQGSEDDSAEMLRNSRRLNQKIHVFYETENKGQCISRNSMASAATGEFILFLDGDIDLIPGSIKAMLDFLQHTDRSIGAVCYDVKSDTPNEADATKAENTILLEDVVLTQRFMFFHYAMWRADTALKHPLPEFAPFNGPGWGCEEDAALLYTPGTTTAIIKYRKFYHARDQRSFNFLGQDALARSRAKRWASLACLKQLDPQQIKECFASRTSPNLGGLPAHVELPVSSLTCSAAMYALAEYMPFDHSGMPSKLGPICIEHELEVLKVDKSFGVNKSTNRWIPKSCSPIWVLANEPVIATNPSKPTCTILRDRSVWSSYDQLLNDAIHWSFFYTDNVHMLLLLSLSGIPCGLIEDVNAPGRRFAVLDYGLLPDMNIDQVLAFRSVVQQRCCSQVIIPLTKMLSI